ncbi:tyrosine-protein kinase family protein [Ferrimonas balearica]|uniref:tyrosine-protein kinase family protein n=1 Tax=Ferrimonas balearica TaxID=44012 RepID=UPI001F4232CF|nr:CpsD/CapB family tyrosine-protein kinase [Ferrimonas balearica]MBY6019360.1 CpsD/CapB family tyrosine-protein kinase [Halomonas denitrificans]MBY6096282.1 CpsD/CapB family tyrosine-protein kinase [Ferrimonas balearica]
MPNAIAESSGVLTDDARRILFASQRQLAPLRGNLFQPEKGALPDSLLVTSARRGEGKTTTAIALAYALSQHSSSKVLLLSADAATSPLARLFQLDGSKGLGQYLLGDDSAQPHPSEFERLDVMPWGEGPRTLWQQSSESLKARWQALLAQYEVVVVDGPAVLDTPETQAIHQHVAATLLVLQCEVTKWQVAQVALERLNSAGGHVIGTVMNQRRYYVPGRLYGKF